MSTEKKTILRFEEEELLHVHRGEDGLVEVISLRAGYNFQHSGGNGDVCDRMR